MKQMNERAWWRVWEATAAFVLGMVVLMVWQMRITIRPAAPVRIVPAVSAQQTPETPVPAVSAQQTPETPVTPPVVPISPTVVIDADAAHKTTADPDALNALRTSINTVLGTQDTGAGDWYTWGQLDSPPITTTISLADAAHVVAVRFAHGATLCIVNSSVHKTPIIVRFHLPHGVYKVERLVMTPATANPTATDQSAAASSTETSLTLERLEGRQLSEAGLIRKSAQLEPGQVCIYRCTDTAGQARAAVASLGEHLHLLANHAPGPAHKLRRIMNEGMSDVYGIASRLSSVHHLLLITAQAHSLCHNYQARTAMHSELGADIMGDLEQLTDSLAETSATLLGLVPQITLAAEMPEANHANAADHATESQKSDYLFSLVTVSLANTGDQSISPVKIGLDSAALPSGVTCAPLDPAIFRTLRPGQTVRATFHLRYSTVTPISKNRCVGDISFFAEGTPAHLRPRPW